ncbi:MAG: hypothetical protein HOE11_01790 [Candidatus Diapherotrites archaeon]|jgi:hypothetical protein|nr:hypothetical protein [Candidatus Diapherotrites archaeon]MBT4597389.1 hypothetical protein [Candidatus Diapherotrites archaeon]
MPRPGRRGPPKKKARVSLSGLDVDSMSRSDAHNILNDRMLLLQTARLHGLKPIDVVHSIGNKYPEVSVGRSVISYLFKK